MLFFASLILLGDDEIMNRVRLARNLKKLAEFGAKENEGITRLAFSEIDWQAIEFIKQLMLQAGMAVRMDDFGNLIGSYQGKDRTLPVLLLGSHIDTVPNGGKYDGTIGVISAIEVVHTLFEQKKELERTVEIVVFRAEESSRFGRSTLGSKAFCGKLKQEDLEEYHDKEGFCLRDALRKVGFNRQDICLNRYEKPIYAFLELHIEQGIVLEKAQMELGVVTCIAAPSRFRLIFRGKADHSGATPMKLRHDALAGIAEVILLVESLAKSTDDVVGTVGTIELLNGAMNVIPGEVSIGIDIRSGNQMSKERVVARLKERIDQIAKSRELTYTLSSLSNEEPVLLDEPLGDLLYEIGTAKKRRIMKMMSGAGHDAMNLAKIAPAAMIFVPSKAGISHNPDEFSSIDEIFCGAELLYETVLHLENKP